MGQTSNQIEQHIKETRNDLSDNFNELEARAKNAIDWRIQFDERPWTFMAAAFGGGLLLSALFPARRTSRRNRWSVPINRDDQFAPARPRADYGRDVAGPQGTWNALKGALVGVATAKLSHMVEELVPSLKEGPQNDRAPNGQQPMQKTARAGSN